LFVKIEFDIIYIKKNLKIDYTYSFPKKFL
jgi:hypothetical protein